MFRTERFWRPAISVLAFAMLAATAITSARAQSAASVELPLAPQPEGSVEAQPINPATAVADGASALISGKPKVAVANYSVALADKGLSKEKRAILLNDRGVALWRDEQAPQAIADFNRAVSLYPEYAAIYNNRGTVLLGLGLVDEAIRDFDRAVLLGPRYASAYTNRAGAQVQRKAYDKALDDYSKAASLRPGDAIAFLGRGRTHLLAGRPFAAERDLTKGISLAPRLVELYEQRRVARAKIGRRDGAFEDLNQIVALRSDTAAAHLLRAEAHLVRNQKKAALRDFDAAIARDPSNVAAHIGRARVMLLYRGVAKAREANETALSLDPESAVAQALDGGITVAEGDIDGGLAAINRVLAKHRKNSVIHLIKARALERAKDSEGAIAAYLRVLALDGKNRAALGALNRYKVPVPGPKSRPVPGAGLEGWRVRLEGRRIYYAVHEKYQNLKVPLEVYGKAKPRITDWELKTGEFRGVGLLRYTAGTRKIKGKATAIEQAAIVDLKLRRVHGLEPVRVGKAAAVWNWDAGAVSVKGTDGLVNTYNLRRAAVASRPKRRTRRAEQKSDWLADPWGIQGTRSGTRAQKRRSKRRSPSRRKKKKSLFDLIFQ